MPEHEADEMLGVPGDHAGGRANVVTTSPTTTADPPGEEPWSCRGCSTVPDSPRGWGEDGGAYCPECRPKMVTVPAEIDALGTARRPVVATSPEAASHWDERLWNRA